MKVQGYQIISRTFHDRGYRCYCNARGNRKNWGYNIVQGRKGMHDKYKYHNLLCLIQCELRQEYALLFWVLSYFNKNIPRKVNSRWLHGRMTGSQLLCQPDVGTASPFSRYRATHYATTNDYLAHSQGMPSTRSVFIVLINLPNNKDTQGNQPSDRDARWC